ncbi:MAG: TerB family tellurite resistance protein [Lewinellaceae bacterium]|nr:TerB family tellurite resistance protein [Saprospiraceae bacterium]MCB9344912.1 TerB family tellurite resistance protein [Lewinellaceae bacterium]
MELKGKLLFGIAGMILFDLMNVPLGGLIGFFVGSLAGHYLLDKPRETTDSESTFRAYQRRRGEFLFHVFRLCAKMAKSDGAVSKPEVTLMENLMRNHFRLNDKSRSQAIRVWKQAKDSSDSFDQYARAFYHEFGRERHQVMNMMDLLFATAAADGGLHPREEELLLRAAGIFHIGRMQYDRIKSRYYQTNYRQYKQQQGKWSALDPHYAILEAKPTDSLEIIKKKYRALAVKWHPDKMLANGASSEALRHAQEKFQKINDAYDKILEARK